MRPFVKLLLPLVIVTVTQLRLTSIVVEFDSSVQIFALNLVISWSWIYKTDSSCLYQLRRLRAVQRSLSRWNFTEIFGVEKASVPRLSLVVDCLTICKSIMTLYQRMTDRQTDRRNARTVSRSAQLCCAGGAIKILPPGHEAGSVALLS